IDDALSEFSRAPFADPAIAKRKAEVEILRMVQALAADAQAARAERRTADAGASLEEACRLAPARTDLAQALVEARRKEQERSVAEAAERRLENVLERTQ